MQKSILIKILLALLFISCSNSDKTLDNNKKEPIAKKEKPEKKKLKPVKSCKVLLKNSNFDDGVSNWQITGIDEIVEDGVDNSHALNLQGTIEQFSQEITEVDTFQFEGYYKMYGDTNITATLGFYDNDKNFLFERSYFMKKTSNLTYFMLNATSTKETKFIKATISTSATNGNNNVVLDNLTIKSSTCYNYTIASSLIPKSLSADEVPQFVVLGFDDNTRSEGIEWALNIFDGKKNQDGSDVKTSFYLNTSGLKRQIEDDPNQLKTAMEHIKKQGFEIGNHTDNHNPQLAGETYDEFTNRINNLDYTHWKERIDTASTDIKNYLGVNIIKGFRTPYLMYNKYTFDILKEENYLYDCSIEDGFAPEMDGTNFRWPYQLNAGSPGHNENWRGNQENSDYIPLGKIEGVWELPSYPLVIPKDNKCEEYGIQTGLWDRLVAKIDYLKDQNYKMTGLDYNLWSEGNLTKEEVLGILKYNLDLRLKGNRAPFMIGTHSQYYTKEWADNNAPNADVTGMREAITEFINYALSKEEVRITTGEDIIKWCQNPQAIK